MTVDPTYNETLIQAMLELLPNLIVVFAILVGMGLLIRLMRFYFVTEKEELQYVISPEDKTRASVEEAVAYHQKIQLAAELRALGVADTAEEAYKLAGLH